MSTIEEVREKLAKSRQENLIACDKNDIFITEHSESVHVVPETGEKLAVVENNKRNGDNISTVVYEEGNFEVVKGKNGKQSLIVRGGGIDITD